MAQNAWSFFVLVALSACATDRSARITDPIPEIPESQQRVVTRSELGWQWPFTGGIGTLGCASGAVVFRFGGASYAVNETAKSRGFASIEPIWRTSSEPPRDPLKRLPQNQRMQIFREASACNVGSRQMVDTNRCKQRLQEMRSLSESELKQIEAEGLERTWPPLPPKRMSLVPLVDVGLQLCPPPQGVSHAGSTPSG
jgi:hypothetical protein